MLFCSNTWRSAEPRPHHTKPLRSGPAQEQCVQPLRFNYFLLFQEFLLWWLQRYWEPSKMWWATSSPTTGGLAACFGALLLFWVTRPAQEQPRGCDQALQMGQSALRAHCAAFPDQCVHLSNREIVMLVSKVMIIFAPFHLFDAAAVSIPARGAVPLCKRGYSGECKAAFSSFLIYDSDTEKQAEKAVTAAACITHCPQHPLVLAGASWHCCKTTLL